MTCNELAGKLLEGIISKRLGELCCLILEGSENECIGGNFKYLRVCNRNGELRDPQFVSSF